jgi:mobile mystery protein A
MKGFFPKLMREQVQAGLNDLNELAKRPKPSAGWIKVIRQALGMTSYQLAKRIGCSQSNVAALERREKAGAISLNALEQAANAMNCRCVYFFIPQKPLIQIMEDQAHVIAKKRLQFVAHSMELEQQGLTPQQAKLQEEILVSELLQNPKAIWEE